MTDRDAEEQKRQSIQHIADQAAAKAVRDTLMLIGIDVTDPIAAQSQFAALRELAKPRTLDNLAWLESVHIASEKAADMGWRTVVRVLVTAGLGGLAFVLKDYWVQHIWK